MGYQFAGFFAKGKVPPPDAELPGVVWREVAVPFHGVGVRLASLLGKIPPPDAVRLLAEQFGILPATEWLYITYCCWAGRIDSVYGLGVRDGREFGPIEEEHMDRTRAAYLELMGEFGVSSNDALRFPPFERGFWGEQ